MTRTKHDMIADMAIRVARAELERDLAVERAEKAEEQARDSYRAWGAVRSGDKDRILEAVNIIGIPARDLSDIYRLEAEWRKNGGSDELLADLRRREKKSA